MNIYQAVIASSYGRGSVRPFRTACKRLTCLWAGAVVISMVVAGNFDGLPPSQSINPYLVFPTVLIAQATVLITLISSQAIGLGKSDSLARIFAVLPLTDTQRWLLMLLPALLLSGLSLSLLAWPAGTLLIALGLPPFLFVLSIFVGGITALGMVYASLPSKYGSVRYICIAIILWFEYRAVSMLSATPVPNKYIVGGLLICLFTCLSVLFVMSKSRVIYRSVAQKQRITTGSQTLPASLWFLKKMLRSTSTRHGFAVALLLSFILAWACDKQQLMDSSVPGLATCLIAASYASDMRALCRRLNPPEIVALRGTASFVRQYVTTTVSVSFLTSVPFLAVGLPSQPLAHTLSLGCMSILGGCIGTIASTLIIPEPRDVTSQFLTTLVCIGLTGLFLKFSGNNLSATPALLTEVGVSLFCLLSTYVIEYKRNAYIWRNHVTNKHITA